MGSNFPESEIFQAYLDPQVNKDSTRFDFQFPDVDGLRNFCANRLGWPSEDTDKQILPLIARLKDNLDGQQRLDSYYVSYHDNAKVASIRSERLKNTVSALTSSRERTLHESSV